jgi:hypothetical protein
LKAIGAGRWVCIGSNISIAREWRRGARGVPAKDLLLALAVLRYLESGADVMIGTMRNNRGMNALAYRLGAHALCDGLLHHGVDVDLVAFDRNSANLEALDPALRAIVESLWAHSKNQESFYEIGALPVREAAG